MSLGGKFVALTVLVLSITLSSAAIYNYKQDERQLVKDLDSRINSLIQFASHISIDAVLSYDFGILNNYMATLTKSRDVVYAVVTSPEGVAITTHIDQKSKYISGLDQSDILTLLDNINRKKDIITKSYPIIFESKTLAHIRIGISKKRIIKETRQSLQNQLFIGLSIIIILSLLIYVVFRHYALKPIVELTQGAMRIKQGKLEKCVRIFSNDELGVLGRSFNEMMGTLKSNIEQKDDALYQHQQLNKTLENRVENRTHELARVNEELERLALYDSLTNLPNRALIQDRISSAIQNAKRENESFTIIMMDLNRFKEVNDSLGHDCGDSLLIEVGNRISDKLRKRDTVGRLGGDEFTLILPKTDLDGAITAAENILNTLEPPVLLQGLSFPVAASLGVAVYPIHGENNDQLMKHADIAMYHAKQHHDGYCVFDYSLDHIASPDSLSLMGEFKKAISNDGLELYFQPQKDTKTQDITGVEALTRWIHPEKGFIPPDEFIPIAERTGLIKPLTHWVLDKAMSQWREWYDDGINISISVNVSMHDIQDAHFIDHLSQLIKKWQFIPEALCLEITESTIMSNTDYVMKVLQKLESMNIELSIDDFGTGYSSLSNLKQLPVQEIKVDRSFVMDMVNDSNDLSIVTSIIKMAHAMDLRVVAEGVEDQVCEALLIEMGCDRIQGYFIQRPQPANEITEFLREANPVLYKKTI